MSQPAGGVSTGYVILSVVVCLGDVDGDGELEYVYPDGQVTFSPVNRVTLTGEEPESLLVGSEDFTAKVDGGYLVNAALQPWVALSLGQWRVTFDIDQMPLNSTIIEVRELHTMASPLDLGVWANPGITSLLEPERLYGRTDIVVIDAGDGGGIIANQDFKFENGARGVLTITDEGDGGAGLVVT